MSVRHFPRLYFLAVIHTEPTISEWNFPSFFSSNLVPQNNQTICPIYLHICQHVSLLGINIIQISLCDILLQTECLCPPKIHTLKPNVMCLEVEPLEGISALIKRDTREIVSFSLSLPPHPASHSLPFPLPPPLFLSLLPPCEDPARRQPSANQENSLPQALPSWHSDLRFPSPQNHEKSISIVFIT